MSVCSVEDREDRGEEDEEDRDQDDDDDDDEDVPAAPEVHIHEDEDDGKLLRRHVGVVGPRSPASPPSGREDDDSSTSSSTASSAAKRHGGGVGGKQFLLPAEVYKHLLTNAVLGPLGRTDKLGAYSPSDHHHGQDDDDDDEDDDDEDGPPSATGLPGLPVFPAGIALGRALQQHAAAGPSGPPSPPDEVGSPRGRGSGALTAPPRPARRRAGLRSHHVECLISKQFVRVVTQQQRQKVALISACNKGESYIRIWCHTGKTSVMLAGRKQIGCGCTGLGAGRSPHVTAHVIRAAMRRDATRRDTLCAKR